MWSTKTRDVLCFALGALGFLHELFLSNIERPFLLTASLALMGFPFVLNGESRLRGRKDE